MDNNESQPEKFSERELQLILEGVMLCNELEETDNKRYTIVEIHKRCNYIVVYCNDKAIEEFVYIKALNYYAVGMMYSLDTSKELEYAGIFYSRVSRNGETKLRLYYTEQRGISFEEQENILKEIANKAKPGTQIGPWKLGENNG